MSTRNPWGRHYQTVWEERAGDPRMPLWFRVIALAYGKHRANGHAMFKAGQVGLVLGRADPVTGELVPLDRGNVSRAIRTAVEYGLLDKSSGSRCLVVPGHAIEGGLGSPFEPCPQHDADKRCHSVTAKRLKVVS